MSVSTEGANVPVGLVPEPVPPALLRAMQPAGAVFALGWTMAELFDPRRRVSDAMRQPPFDPDTQLPLVADLEADPKLVFLAAQLAELLQFFPGLAAPLALVTAQTDKKKAAVEAENLATATAAEQADDVAAMQAAAAAVVEAPFSETDLLAAVAGLNQAILDEFAADPERLSAYQLGLSLSDLTWVPRAEGSGLEAPAARPSALFGLFSRTHLSTVQTLLSGAGQQLPAGSATIVSRSLSNWADWIDVNTARIGSANADAWSENAGTVLAALRVQGWIWRSVLTGDTGVTVQPSMSAWVQAASSMVRAARLITISILRRFWPIVVIAVVALGGLLALIIANLSGISQVWASLFTVVAILGSGGYGLSSGVSQSFAGVGYDVWNAAKTEASAWSITWLPAMSATPAQRAELDRRGVAAPQLRKNLDLG
ncbi:hypothetical protein EAS64_30970 [Trebonia kvetii]|uniref:Uncharacterized protein n=1 Tax=Trebonia kvetii TaxID=2480626 RepID=A0A6P2BUS1_9ACTN|nr:hypothetical protein [Trebonia kvetii]TVZ01865.1 hypothetical protein EAS64_30970 [Trebonia kvetii]